MLIYILLLAFGPIGWLIAALLILVQVYMNRMTIKAERDTWFQKQHLLATAGQPFETQYKSRRDALKEAVRRAEGTHHA